MGSLTSVVALSKQSQVLNPKSQVPKLRDVAVQLSICPWAHPFLQECCLHCLSFSPWIRYWQLLLRAEQPLCFVRPGPGHGTPRQLLDEVASQHDHPLWLLVLVQDREVLQLQRQLCQWGPATQGKPPRLDLQEHSGWRLWDPSHQLCAHNIIVRQ